MKQLRPLLFFLIVIYVFSCVHVVKCPNENLIPVLKGYRTNEADTIILKNYVKGSNFTNFVDSMIVPLSYTQTTPTDTSYFFPLAFIEGKYEVKIINPFDNKTVAVSQIKYDAQEVKKSACSRIDCTSPVSSFNRDGVLQTKGNNQQFNQIIISK